MLHNDFRSSYYQQRPAQMVYEETLLIVVEVSQWSRGAPL